MSSKHPFGRDEVGDANRVVEAVAARHATGRLRHTEGHEVAEHGERRRRHLQQLRHARPQRGAPVARRAVHLARRAPHRDALLDARRDRRASGRCGTRDRGTRRARARSASPPTARRSPSGAYPSAAFTVMISSSPSRITTRPCVIWLPVTASVDVDVEHSGRPGKAQVLRGGPHHRPAAGLLQRNDAGREAGATEQETSASADPIRDGQAKLRWILGGFKSQERRRIHRP